MGFIRKALFIATVGLSGRVFKDNPKKEHAAKAAEKQVRPRKQTKRAARRPTPRAARTSTAAQPGNATANQLERLAELHGRGALTGEEFAAAKAKILGTSLAPHGSDIGPATFPAVEANVAAARDLADLAANDSGALASNDSGAPVATVSGD